MPSEHRDIGVVSATFRDFAVAEQALADLRVAGFSRMEISSADLNRDACTDTSGSDDDAGRSAQTFFNSHESTASSFSNELAALGFSNHDAHDLVDVMTSGGAIVTADADGNGKKVLAILRRYSDDIRYAATSTDAPIADAEPSTDDVEQIVKLRAEHLAIKKRKLQHGEARVRKEVITHIQSIDVPVKREELVVEQVMFNDDGSEAPIEVQDVIRIPLSEEQVTVTKSTSVTEDVRIGKRLVEETEHISATTREEQLRVSDGTFRPEDLA